MSKAFKDPSLLTKDRLKKELESNGIQLPRGDQKKDFYVKLYRENLSPQSGRRLGNGEFSSDDDDYDQSPQRKQIVPRTSRSIKKFASKEIVSDDIKSLSNEELREELTNLGQSVGPIMPSTRGLYEKKLARLHASSPNNGSTITTLSRSEFSDNDFEEEVREEPYIPEDEFFYDYHGRNSQNTGDTFGATFTKNFENSSSKKEVMRDMSVSSSRNVERSSTVDRKTMNKVRMKKGDKFEENSWSTSGSGSRADEAGDDEEEAVQLNALPANVQRALTAAKRFNPEKAEKRPEVRERLWRQNNTEEVPKDERRTSVEEKPKKKQEQKTSSRKWWILMIIVVLIIFTCAVVYHFEGLPAIKKGFLL